MLLTLLDLTDDALIDIFRLLPVPDVLTLRLVNRRLYELTRLRVLWHYYFQDLEDEAIPTPYYPGSYVDLDAKQLEERVVYATLLQRRWAPDWPDALGEGYTVVPTLIRNSADSTTEVHPNDIVISDFMQGGRWLFTVTGQGTVYGWDLGGCRPHITPFLVGLIPHGHQPTRIIHTHGLWANIDEDREGGTVLLHYHGPGPVADVDVYLIVWRLDFKEPTNPVANLIHQARCILPEAGFFMSGLEENFYGFAISGRPNDICVVDWKRSSLQTIVATTFSVAGVGTVSAMKMIPPYIVIMGSDAIAMYKIPAMEEYTDSFRTLQHLQKFDFTENEQTEFPTSWVGWVSDRCRDRTGNLLPLSVIYGDTQIRLSVDESETSRYKFPPQALSQCPQANVGILGACGRRSVWLGPATLEEEGDDEDLTPPCLHLYSYSTGRHSNDALVPTFMPCYSPDWLTRHFSLVAFDEETGRVCLLDEHSKRLKILDFGPVRASDGRRELAFHFEAPLKAGLDDSEVDNEQIGRLVIRTESSLE